VSADLRLRKISLQGFQVHTSIDRELWVEALRRKQGLRIETPEARKAKSISTVDLKEVRSDSRRFERGDDLNRQFRSTIKIVRSMVTLDCGARKCSTLKFRGRAAIETTVSERGTWQLEVNCGEKSGLIQTTLGHTHNHAFTQGHSPGHMQEGANGRGACA
jgi:hypothetical protein